MSIPSQRVEFEPQYTPALLGSAAREFVRGHLFAVYGRWLVLACIVNALAFVLVLWLGIRDVSAWFMGALALVGPVWLVQFYIRYPGKFAARASRAEPLTRIALTPDNVELTNKHGSASVPWSKFKAVVDTPTAFLLVLSPFAFLPLPKQGIPPEAVSFLEHRRSSRVA